MASLEDKGFTSQMQSSDINLNLITFPFKNSSRTIQWHKASFNDVIRVQYGDPVQWVIEFTIHTRDRYSSLSINTKFLHQYLLLNIYYFDFRVNLTSFPKYEILPKHQRLKEMRAFHTSEQNRYILTLSLDHANITDMGYYQLIVYNEENETPFEPNLDMTLYVESKPEVTLAAENPKGFYEENQNVTISCDVVSYPINITRYSITV